MLYHSVGKVIQMLKHLKYDGKYYASNFIITMKWQQKQQQMGLSKSEGKQKLNL